MKIGNWEILLGTHWRAVFNSEGHITGWKRDWSNLELDLCYFDDWERKPYLGEVHFLFFSVKYLKLRHLFLPRNWMRD